MKSIIAALILSTSLTIALPEPDNGSDNASIPGPLFHLQTHSSESEYDSLFISLSHIGSLLYVGNVTKVPLEASNFTSNCPDHTLSGVIHMAGNDIEALGASTNYQDDGTNITPLYFDSSHGKPGSNSWGFDCDNYLTFNGSSTNFSFCSSTLHYETKQYWVLNVQTQEGTPTNDQCHSVTLQAVFD